MEARPSDEVWELQRRATLFHTAWRAPFLPHDGQKRWRWVDSAYQRHPLAAASLKESALGNSPPGFLRPAPDRPPDQVDPGAWAVVLDESRGPCGEQGWQYAVDFYESDRWWQRDPRLCHCRRRLWRRSCSGEEPLDEAPPLPPMPAASPGATSVEGPLAEVPRRCSAPAASPAADPVEASRRASMPAASLAAFLGEGEAPRRASVPAASPAAGARVRALEEELVPLAASSPASLASEVEGIFAPEWGPGSLLVDFLGAQGATDIRVGPWLQGPGDGDRRAGVREVQMLQPVPPAPMAPRTTRATVRYHVWAEGDGPAARLCWEAAVATLDTPFCDCYTILDRVVLSPASGGITVQKEFCVQYSKRTFARSIIESSARAVQKQVAQVLLEVLRRRALGAGAADRTDLQPATCHEADEDPRITEVWELQRRKTLFHGTWQAPFLPHDGQKQWRWVDRRYRRHPWAAEGSRRASAGASRPPLGPRGCGGREGAQWVLAEAPGPSDDGGWQYAVDFYSSDARWGSSRTMCHCRRRLWRLERSTAPSSEQSVPRRSATEGRAAEPRRAVAPRVAIFVCAAVVSALLRLHGPTAATFGVGAFSRTALLLCTLTVLCGGRAGLGGSKRLLHSAADWAGAAVWPKAAVAD